MTLRIGIGNIRIQSAFSWSSYWNQLKNNRSTDEVVVNSILPVTNGATFLDNYAAPNGLSWIPYTYGWGIPKCELIRQTGNLTKVDLCKIQNQSKLSKLDLIIWRRASIHVYNKIATIDCLPVNNGLNTKIFGTSIPVLEGDAYGFQVIGTAGQSVGYDGNASYVVYYKDGAVGTPFDWPISATGSLNILSVCHFYMQAPLIIAIGDSLMASQPSHSSFIDSSFTNVDLPTAWTTKLLSMDSSCVFQNCGLGNRTTTQILAAFDTYCINAKPKITVINGGINDIAGGVITKATFLSNWTSMLDKCVTANIFPICWGIMPWNAGTNVQMQTRDDWNASLKTLVESYTNIRAKYINWDILLGQFRAGGDAGNLWDIIPSLKNVDNVHLNNAGYTIVANTVYNVLRTGQQ